MDKNKPITQQENFFCGNSLVKQQVNLKSCDINSNETKTTKSNPLDFINSETTGIVLSLSFTSLRRITFFQRKL